MEQLLADIAELKARVAALEAEKRKSSLLLLSKAEAARRLGIDRNITLGFLIESKQLKLVKFGRYKRIPAADVERLVQEGFKRH